jgi:hypothetical protein
MIISGRVGERMSRATEPIAKADSAIGLTGHLKMTRVPAFKGRDVRKDGNGTIETLSYLAYPASNGGYKDYARNSDKRRNRESEGFIVPMTDKTTKLVRGKGPCHCNATGRGSTE